MSLPMNEEELAERVAALKADRSNEIGKAAIDGWAHGVRLLWGTDEDDLITEGDEEGGGPPKQGESKAALLNAMTASLRLALACDKAESDAILRELRDRKRAGDQQEASFAKLAAKPKVLRGGKS